MSPGAEPVLGTEGEDRAAAPSMAENATGIFTAQKSASVATTLADSTSQKRATEVTKPGCSGSKSKYVRGLCRGSLLESVTSQYLSILTF